MDNLTAGNPRAHAVRVYFENSGSATIYEGMPLCYNYDTTDNWFGGTVTDGAVSATGTTAEGSQNEGKYIRVELPANNNLMSFAGVVKKGGWCGKADARALDIYVPNGAIVPVRCDVDTTVGVTILGITVAMQELGACVAGTSRPVAIAAETETGLDSTAGITLATLDPNRFVYQNLDGTSLSAGAAADFGDVVVNSIKVTTAQTDDRFTAFEILAEVTSTASSMSGGCGYGLALYTETNVSGILSDSTNSGVSFWTNINAGADLTCKYFGLEIGIYEGGADLSSCGILAPLCLRQEIDGTDGPTANTQFMMYLRSDGTGDQPDGLFAFYDAESIKFAAQSSAGVSHTIPIYQEIGDTTYYIMVSDTA